jgi:small subunit ribosomal protein S16
MALKIRLRRMGRRNAPTYRIVVAESSMPRDGRIVASIGHYNPRTTPVTLSVDRTQALHWIEVGAQPTETAKALLKRAGIFRPEESVVAAAAATVVEAVKDTAKKATGAAKTVASKAKAAGEKAADAAKDVAEDVREVAADAVEAIADVAETVREKASDVVEAAGGGDEAVEAVAAGDEAGEAKE